MIGDEHTVDFFHDLWISNLSFSKWPTFISMKIGKIVRILELLHNRRCRWCDDQVARFFGPDLANRVLSIIVPTHDAQDMRV